MSGRGAIFLPPGAPPQDGISCCLCRGGRLEFEVCGLCSWGLIDGSLISKAPIRLSNSFEFPRLLAGKAGKGLSNEDSPGYVGDNGGPSLAG